MCEGMQFRAAGSSRSNLSMTYRPFQKQIQGGVFVKECRSKSGFVGGTACTEKKCTKQMFLTAGVGKRI